MPMEGKTTKVVVIIAITAFILVVLFVIWQYGAQGILTVAKMLGIWLLVITAIALVVWVVIWLFRTKQIDLIAVHKERIIAACKISKPAFKQTLAFKPFGDDWVYREVGTVQGMCMIKTEPKKIVPDKVGDALVLEILNQPYENMIFVAFLPPGLIGALFGGVLGMTEVCGGIPADFSALSGEIVYLNGMSFSPKLYDIYFLAHHWESRYRIDETIKSNIYRYTLQENLKDMATLMEDAIDASPKHKKEQEMRNVQNLSPSQAPPQQR